MPDFSDEDTFSESEEQGRFGTVEGVNGECEEEPDSTATALLIDKRLLQKDFIVNSFSDAAEYYNKVQCVNCALGLSLELCFVAAH